MSKISHSAFVKQAAKQAGFEYCGIAKAERLDEDARRLEKWLKNGFHGNMHYMENHFDLRIDPSKLVPGAKSVITLLKNYYTDIRQNTYSPKISRYAYGNDYHEVIKSQLRNFLDLLANELGEIHGRGFVDSAPVLERTWARKSGLGWIGKNGNLINKDSGSFYFIATMITDLELEYDDALAKDYCGTCTKCIDECPTDAILPGKVVDGSKCISYFTIELKEMLIPGEMKDKFKDWAFGCDICQDVCPWNRFSKNTNETAFTPLPEVLNFTTKDWEALTDESFKKIFKHSPINRAKLKGMQRNIRFINTDE